MREEMGLFGMGARGELERKPTWSPTPAAVLWTTPRCLGHQLRQTYLPLRVLSLTKVCRLRNLVAGRCGGRAQLSDGSVQQYFLSPLDEVALVPLPTPVNMRVGRNRLGMLLPGVRKVDRVMFSKQRRQQQADR